MNATTTAQLPARGFRYRALDATGRDVAGVVAASSREAALQSLSRSGLAVYDLNAESDLIRVRQRLSAAQLAFVLRILANLLDAGLPVSRALAALDEVAPPAFRRGLPRLRQEVQEGKGLSSAMTSALPDTPAIVIGIIRSGEAGSGLGLAVYRAAEMLEEVAAVRALIRSALAYPLILAISAFAAVVLLVTIVLPRFQLMFSDVGQTLPPSTRLVLRAAGIAGTMGPVAGVLAPGALVVFWLWHSSAQGMRSWHKFLLRVPILGQTRRSAATARTCAALSALLETGVPLSGALVHAARASGDAELTARLLEVRGAVVRGERLSDALSTYDATTSTVVRLVRVGEESGRLSSLVSHGSRIEREFAVQRTRSIVKLIEPSLILLFGGLVALVAAAMLQAMYSLRPGA